MSASRSELEFNAQHGGPAVEHPVVVSQRGRRLLVTGGRKFRYEPYVQAVLAEYRRRYGIDFLIVGDAQGVDRFTYCWAKQFMPDRYKVFCANWRDDPVHAGTARNTRMLVEANPTHGLVFPGGSGTRDMIRKLLDASIQYDIASFILPLPY